MNALELVTWWPVDAAAGGVVRRSGPPGTGSTTVVDEVGDVERPFAWASVTKLLVAMAVLVAVEEGTIALDEPAGPPGSTVRHLLAHASGLGPDSPVPVAGLARMRIYSNVGYDILATTLAEHAHMPFADYLAGGVLAPLGMSSTSLPPGSSPASGVQGSLADLLTLARELLDPSIVSPATLAMATRVTFPGLRGVLPGYGRFDPCDWGLGFEVKGSKDPHWTGAATSPSTFGHFGRAGGFVWVDPAAGLACATLSNREFGPWAVTEWATLADAVVDQWALPPVIELPQAARARRAAADEERRAHAEQRAAEAAEAADAERRAQAEVLAREAADANERARAEQREVAAALQRAQDEQRQRQAAEAEQQVQAEVRARAEQRAAEAERQADERQADKRQADERKAAEVEAQRQAHEHRRAEGERQARADAEAERQVRALDTNEAEQRARQMAAAEQAELAERNAVAQELRRDRESARVVSAAAERKKRESTKAERRRKKAARAIAAGGKATPDARQDDSIVAAMTEHRVTVMARVPDSATSTTKGDEIGPLGPGIRPADFWGS